MSTALNITDAYMESLYKLSDEEKISLATRLLNSLKGTFKNIDEEKFYDEYIEEKYGI